MIMYREQGSFNSPAMNVDEGKHERRKAEREEKEKSDMLRDEIEIIKNDVSENYCAGKRRGTFLGGTEILNVDTKDLTEEDLGVYKKLKNFKMKKVPFDEMWQLLQRYKYEVAKKATERKAKNPDYDFMKDSRSQFFAWMSLRFLAESTDRKYKEKRKKAWKGAGVV